MPFCYPIPMLSHNLSHLIWNLQCMKHSSVSYTFWEGEKKQLIFYILIITVCYWTTCARNNAAFCSPSMKESCDNHCYPSSKSGNLSCFDGHTDTPSDHKDAGEFYVAYSSRKKKWILWYSKYGNIFCMITVLNTILTRTGTYVPHSQSCNFFQQVLQTCVKVWFNSDCWRNFLWGLCVPHQNLK
jgi:hypothetical protein